MHPLAGELAALSASIADELDARLALIDRMRREPVTPVATAAAPAAQRALDETTVAPIPPIVAQSPAPSPAPAAAREPATAPAVTPRRSGVQVALIVVGIALLSVFALFAVIYAFIAYGVVVRSLVIGAATIATIVTATVLSRRGLAVTAEGLAALGTVVLVLDAWAVRRTDVAGLSSTPELAYWGVALVAISVIALTWARAGGHRSPVLAAAVMLPIGAGLLGAHATTGLARGADVTVGALTAAATAALVAAALHRIMADRITGPVRAASVASTLLSVPIAASAIVVSAELLAERSWVWPSVSGVIFASLVIGATLLALRALSGVAAAVTSAALAVSGTLALLATLTIAADETRVDGALLAVSVLAPVVVAVTADAAARRHALARIPLIATAASAGAIGALAALGAFGVVAEPLVRAALAGLGGPVARPTIDVMGADALVSVAVASLAAGAGVLAGGWALAGLLRSRSRLVPLAALAAVVVVSAVSLSPTWLAAMLASGAVAIASAAALLPLSRRDDRTAEIVAARVALAIGSPLAAVLAVSMAWAVTDGWWLGTVTALAAIALGRAATVDRAARSIAVGVSSLLILVAAAALADPIEVDAPSFVLVVAAALIALSGLPGLSGAERLTGLITPLPIVVTLALDAIDTSPVNAAVDTVALAALVGAFVVVAVGSRGTIERAIASALIGPAVALAAGRALVLGLALAGDTRALAITPIEQGLVALIALATVAVIAALRTAGSIRIGLDAGVTVAALVALVTVAEDGTRGTLMPTALAVLVCAVITLAIAITREGLFLSSSPRRFVGWLALALATIALWTMLVDRGTADPEPYVLPLAAALIVIAILIGRTPDAASRRAIGVPALLVGAAIIVAGVPLAAASGEGPAARGVAVGLGATLIALAALMGRIRGQARWRGLHTVVLTAAVVAQLTLTTSVVAQLFVDGTGAALPAVQVAGILVVVMLTGTATAAWATASRGDNDRVRAPHVTATTAATAGGAALAAAVIGLLDAVRPIELVTVPLALGLIMIGTLELDQRASARSGPWLTPGLVALLVPSLIAIGDDGDVVRIVSVGLVATIVLIGGVVRRLQAPFLVGGVVLITHLVIQSWPLLAEIGRAVEWWLWLGIAGVAVVAVAARYEQRLRDLRTTVGRIRDLR